MKKLHLASEVVQITYQWFPNQESRYTQNTPLKWSFKKNSKKKKVGTHKKTHVVKCGFISLHLHGWLGVWLPDWSTVSLIYTYIHTNTNTNTNTWIMRWDHVLLIYSFQLKSMMRLRLGKNWDPHVTYAALTYLAMTNTTTRPLIGHT